MIKNAKSKTKFDKSYNGLFVVGDPHVEGRKPNFRCDDYPQVILDKLRWCLQHAAQQRLLPVFLGDMFEKPRDNPTWMVGQLVEMMIDSGAVGIYGNHDCAEPQLTDNDSLMILIKAGCMQLVSEESPWVGLVNGRKTVIGGSSYREPVPERFDVEGMPKDDLFAEQPMVVWLTHHDIDIGDYENGRIKPFSIENVPLLINGHIHRRMAPVEMGETLWMTPGNISRRSRSDAARRHEPAAMLVTVSPPAKPLAFETTYVAVPHESADKVFYEAVADELAELGPSAFIAGLRELQQTRTESGAGLHEFLQKNIQQFSDDVAAEIMTLAESVTNK